MSLNWRHFEFEDPDDLESVRIPEPQEGKMLLHLCNKNAGSGPNIHAINAFTVGINRSQNDDTFFKVWEDSADQTIHDYCIEKNDYYCILDINHPNTTVN